jgi:gas vesicle protein
MQDNTNIQSTPKGRETSQPTVRKNVTEELDRLRDELARTAHDIRLKSKDASAEVQDTRRMLEREAKRFSAEVEEAVQRTQEDLLEAGKDLRVRFQKLAKEIGLPLNQH